MEQQINEALTNVGINIPTAMNRFFDNEEMYFSFLMKFTEDDLMIKLKEYIEKENIKEAFDAAHTLKGVCANLSIDSMNEILNPMVEVLRVSSLEGLKTEYDKLLVVYNNVVGVINTYCK